MVETKKVSVSIIMGSDSDLPGMKEAADLLSEFGIEFEIRIVSAHRTPHLLYDYCRDLLSREVKVVIAGAGGAAHLPGMVAAMTPLPVIGVPLSSRISLDGWDSVLSILQMPPGIPVATVALNGARNAGILAAQILGSHQKAILEKVIAFKAKQERTILEKAENLKRIGYKNYLEQKQEHK